MTTETATMTAPTVHRWEAAGLGKAPFRFLGVSTEDDRIEANRARELTGEVFTTNPSTSCDYCGTAIVDAYQFRSADGRTFKVGCDCVTKAGDAGLTRQIDPARKAAAKAKRHAREAAKIADGKAWIEANRGRLAEIPHPTARRAADGETLADMVDWYFRNAGTSGRLDALRIAKRLAGD